MGMFCPLLMHGPDNEIFARRADEVIRAMTEWPDILFDQKTAYSEELNETGIQKALNMDLAQWAYYDTPEGRYRSDRFNVAMSGASKLHPPLAVVIGTLSPGWYTSMC